MKIGSNDYKLIYLDTNALREIVLNNDESFHNFIEKFLSGDLVKYAPVFSIYNVFELKPYADIYKKFIEVFTVIPCMMFFPYNLIIQEEYKAFCNSREVVLDGNLIHAFSALGPNDSFKLEAFLEELWKDEKIKNDIMSEILGLKEIATTWNEQKASYYNSSYMLKHCDLKKLYYKLEKETIIKDLGIHGMEVVNDVDIKRLPGMRVMEFSHFMRVYDRKKSIKLNDVMDVKMSSFIPYVDAVITEAYQAELYKNMKSFINQLKNLEIFGVNDLKS
jgi:hypothetical protein